MTNLTTIKKQGGYPAYLWIKAKSMFRDFLKTYREMLSGRSRAEAPCPAYRVPKTPDDLPKYLYI